MSTAADLDKSNMLPPSKLKKLQSLMSELRSAPDLVAYFEVCVAIGSLIRDSQFSTTQIAIQLAMAKRKVDYCCEIARSFTEVEISVFNNRRNSKGKPLTPTHLRILAKLRKPARTQLLREWQQGNLNTRDFDDCGQRLNRQLGKSSGETSKKATFSTKALTGLNRKLKSMERTLDTLVASDITGLLARRRDEMQAVKRRMHGIMAKIAASEEFLEKQI